jgi:hypothetical protein
MATAMFAEKLVNTLHSTRLATKSQIYTFYSSSENLRTKIVYVYYSREPSLRGKYMIGYYNTSRRTCAFIKFRNYPYYLFID